MDRDWTDKRIDDFADRVGRFEADVKERFDKVDARFDRVEANMTGEFDKVDVRFERLEAKLDRLTYTVWGSIGVTVAVKLLLG